MSKALESLSKIKNDIVGIVDLLKQLGVLVNENQSNKECDIIEKELNKPQKLYNTIKEKRDNAQKDLHKGVVANKIEDVKVELIGQVNAYNDVLSLMENLFEVSEDGK